MYFRISTRHCGELGRYILYYVIMIVSGAAAVARKSRRQWRRRRKSGGGWPRWRNGVRPTYASAGACTTWTRRSTSSGAKCPRSRTKSGCPGSKLSGWPSRTSGSWLNCCSRPRRPAQAATLSSHPRPRRTLCHPNTTTFPTHLIRWSHPFEGWRCRCTVHRPPLPLRDVWFFESCCAIYII